jgi:hypothetical protein
VTRTHWPSSTFLDHSQPVMDLKNAIIGWAPGWMLILPICFYHSW